MIKEKKAKSSDKKKSIRQRKRGVVYIKHLPHGFQEEQLRNYFSQFGAVTRVRLARSLKTLGSKGYAFIEFRYPEVAEIAAEAMNNYLMFKTIIKTRYIPPNEIKYDYFRSGVKKVKKDGVKVMTSKTIEARELAVENNNRLLTTSDSLKRAKKIASKMSKSMKKLEELGIDYDVNVINKSLQKSTTSEDSVEMKEIDIDSNDEFEDYQFEEKSDSEDDVGLKKAIKEAKKVKIQDNKIEKKKNQKSTEENSLAKEKTIKKKQPVSKAQGNKTSKEKVIIKEQMEDPKKIKKIAKSSLKIDKKKPAKKVPTEKKTIKNVVTEIKKGKHDAKASTLNAIKGKKKSNK